MLHSPSRDARLCARRSDDTSGTDSRSLTSDACMSGTEPSGLAWGDYTSTLKPKDMVPTPWMVAMALQADGWYLRSDIIWAKPNPMPESVTDRPTKAHEYLFLLAKRERYYYDAEAIKEASHSEGKPLGFTTVQADAIGRKPSGNQLPEKYLAPRGPTRNRRSVWEIPTQPFPDAHFATYPEKLVEPCVLAGSAEGDTVLDPFAGSGTTGAVACRLGRNFIGTELNPEYAKMAENRIGKACRPNTHRSDKAEEETLFTGP